MSDTIKTGDRVTSPLLVGEWGVLRTVGDAGRTEVCKDGHMLRVPTDSLTLVDQPEYPDEPPVGSVVFVDGAMYVKSTASGDNPWSGHDGGRWKFVPWSEIAARAVPAVDPTNDDHLKKAGLCRVEDVAKLVVELQGIGGNVVASTIRDRFGGAS
jgi:hypothetical protein